MTESSRGRIEDPALGASSYLLPGTPTSFVIDRAGIVRTQHIGFRSDDKPRIRSELAGLLADTK